MRTKLFSMKKRMRAMALGLATMLVVGSVNVMEVSAEEIFTPHYNQETGFYEYDSHDVFRAATHVHLFGNEVKTSAHTHGNIMAMKADLQEIGMRDEKITYPSDYTEYSYVGEKVVLQQITVHDPVIIGPDMEYSEASGQPGGTITNADGTTASALTVYDGVYYKEGAIEHAVDIQGTLDYLTDLSVNDWSYRMEEAGLVKKLTGDENMNNRYIDVNQTDTRATTNIYVNITYEEWTAYSTSIALKGLDSTVTNEGLVIINIDMTGAPDTGASLTVSDMKAYDVGGNEYRNTEHTTSAFGSCRVVYNLYERDTSNPNNMTNHIPYDGEVSFGNVVYGSILAPRATVTVGAINGNVMANKIIHEGQESHRLDVAPVFSYKSTGSVVNKVGKEDISLLLQLKNTPDKTDFYDDPSMSNDLEPIESNTTYTLYTDAAGTTPAYTANSTAEEQQAYAAFNDIKAVWNNDAGKYEMIIGSQYVTDCLNEGTYWLKKTSISDGYADNDTIFKVIIAADGTVTYAKADAQGNVEGTPTRAVMTDVLVKNAPAKLLVEFSNPEGAAPTGDVTYKIYEDTGKTTEVAGSAKNVASEGSGGYSVSFDETVTKNLVQGTTYYIAISDSTSDHKDEKSTVYQVKFDKTTGAPSYRASDNESWSTTVPTDKLIKNDDIQLKVKLDGETTPGSSSDVTYEIYSNENKTSKAPGIGSLEATNNGNGYGIKVDSSATTSNLERNKEYYIAISQENNADYDDEDETIFRVKFDDNGNAWYSEDNGATWSEEVPEDVLVKVATNNPPSSSEPTSEPTSQPTNPPASGENNGGSNTGGQGSSSSANDGGTSGNGGSANNGGATNNGGNNTAGGNTNKGTTDGANANNSATDGANANNSATDGANANNSALTGSNAMNSAKTGEVPTIYIFAGFAALIAIAAGVYVFIKRKRA